METLYKKDSKGKILTWSACVSNSEDGINIELRSGELHGTITPIIRKDIKGKNIGKSNETSPREQAFLDVKSLYKRKKDLGYKSLEDLGYYNYNNNSLEDFLKDTLSIDTTDTLGNLKPMKAQQYYRSKKDWKDSSGKIWKDRKYYYLLNPYVEKEKGAIIIKFPCIIQPKINGVRATISLNKDGKVQILSKEGTVYNIPHIVDMFESRKDLFTYEDDINVIFDGELYIHNEKLQVISSAVKAFNLDTPRINFIAFDLAIPYLNNIDRFRLLKTMITDLNSNTIYPCVEIIKSYLISNDFMAQYHTDRFINNGYEGSILRDIHSLYAFGKRPMTMVKLKRVIDAEFKIIDIIPQEKDESLGLYICITQEGKEFKVTPTGNNEFKSLILFQKHNFIGKQLTCKFYEYTEDKIPFHILDNIIRDYE